MKLCWLLALAPCVVIAQTAQAQTCIGSVPIGNAHHGALTIPIAVSSDTNSVGAGVVVGGDRVFFGAGGSLNHYKAASLNDGSVQAVLGGQIPADASRRVMVCPIASVTYEFATPLVDGVDTAATAGGVDVSGGVQIGFTVYHTDMLQVVPTAGFYVATDYFWLNSQQTGNRSTSESFGRLVAGVGLVFGASAITPEAVVDVGTSTGTHAGFQLSYSFGF